MKLLFVGDVMLGRGVNEVLKKESPQYVWGNTLPIFRQADLRICNLECVLSDRGQRWQKPAKAFYFRSDAKNVEVLKTAGIDIVSNANNHALDFGYEALSDMLHLLDEQGIAHAGAGNDKQAAAQAAIVGRLGFLAFTDNEPKWEASKDKGGTLFFPVDADDQRATDFFSQVKQLKKKVDFLIVSAHWGPNWGYRPQSNHISFAHSLIDAGADVIFGHSCHVFQGVEIYKGRPILYSTGDFIDDYAVDVTERNDESFIFMVEINDDNDIASLRLYPTVIENFQANLAEKKRAEKIAQKMIELCDEFKTRAVWEADNGLLLITNK